MAIKFDYCSLILSLPPTLLLCRYPLVYTIPQAKLLKWYYEFTSPCLLLFSVQPESPRWALARQKEKKYRGFFKASMDFNKVSKDKCEKIFEIMDQSKDHFRVPAAKRKIYTTIDLFRTSQIRKRSFIGMYVW